MKNKMTSIFGTLASIAAMMQAGGVHFGHIGSVTADQALGALGLLGLGWFSKDRNVTGGTIPQTSEAEKRVL